MLKKTIVLITLLLSTLGIASITLVVASGDKTPLDIQQQKIKDLDAKIKKLDALSAEVVKKLAKIDKSLKKTQRMEQQVQKLLTELGTSGEKVKKLTDTVSVDNDGALLVDHIRGGRNIGKRKIGSTEGVVRQVIGDQHTKNGTAAGGFGFISAAHQASPIVWMYANTSNNAFQVINKSWADSISNDPVLFSVNADGNTLVSGDIRSNSMYANANIVAKNVVQASMMNIQRKSDGVNSALLNLGDSSSGITWQLTNRSGSDNNLDIIVQDSDKKYRLIASFYKNGVFALDGKIHTNSSIYAGGDIHAKNHLEHSDERLKQNIQPLASSLAKLAQLRGVSFKWKDEPQDNQIGLVAQEVEKILPEIVSTDSEGYKSIAYGKLTAVLLEAIKELQQQVEELKGRD